MSRKVKSQAGHRTARTRLIYERVAVGRHIGSGKVSSVRRSVSCLSRFELRMRAILLLCQSVGHISEVLKYQMNKNLCLLLFQYFHA